MSTDIDQIPAGGEYFGNVWLPLQEGTPVGEFKFLVDRKLGIDVEIGTAVTAETDEGNFVGVVIDMRTYGSDRDPLSTDFGGTDRIGRIEELMVATVQVFHSRALRPIRRGRVRRATAEEMLAATGYERMDYRVPAGCLGIAPGEFAPVYFDGNSLLGPEAAHLMVSGLSGQAAKTSYMGVLMAAALKADPAKTGEKVAALVFNVKGEDMLFLDKKPEPGYELTEEDIAMYEAMGIDPTPFEDVTVYSPALPGSGGLPSSARQDGTRVLAWSLADVWNYLRYLLRIQDDEKAESFLADYYDTFIRSDSPAKAIYRTFRGLEMFFSEHLDKEDDDEEEDEKDGGWGGWKGHHQLTMRRLRRMLGGLLPRCKGLLVPGESKPDQDVPVTDWTHGQVVVVDIAGLPADVQSLVVARTCERLMRAAENDELGVDHLMVVTDELNVFAPQGATEYRGVRRVLQQIATQGRYAGISLFGAAQKLSKVDELVRDNAATRAMGITPDAELASGVYGRMPRGLQEQIATLPRGYMALNHYSFRAPLVVRFPRPAWKTGKSKKGNRRLNSLDALGLSEKSVERLIEGLGRETAQELIAGAQTPEEAIEILKKARRPDMTKQVVWAPSKANPANPFAEEFEDEPPAEPAETDPYLLD